MARLGKILSRGKVFGEVSCLATCWPQKPAEMDPHTHAHVHTVPRARRHSHALSLSLSLSLARSLARSLPLSLYLLFCVCACNTMCVCAECDSCANHCTRALSRPLTPPRHTRARTRHTRTRTLTLARQDVILHNARRHYSARSLTYVDVLTLSQRDLKVSFSKGGTSVCVLAAAYCLFSRVLLWSLRLLACCRLLDQSLVLVSGQTLACVLVRVGVCLMGLFGYVPRSFCTGGTSPRLRGW